MLPAQRLAVGDVHKIENHMVGADMPPQCFEHKPIAQPDDQNVGLREDVCDVAAYHLRDMRYMLIDETAVGTEEARQSAPPDRKPATTGPCR